MKTRLARKLAAVMYADVANYSRLTGADEEGTHRQLREGLELFDRAITIHGGRTVHYAGDAILAEFDTASDALSCAVSAQNEMVEKNLALAHDKRLTFRVGLNIGEVIVDRDDIYGEGVNVAARLQEEATPGGICISDSFRVAVGNRFEFEYRCLGEKRLKNIAEPRRVYEVTQPAVATTSYIDAATSKPSIAVLALDNMSGNPEQEYFSDGISEDIITELSKLSGLFVIARNSSFVYKGRQVSAAEISKQLGVRYLLEGSVRKAGARVRVTVQLIDGESGGHIWAERYDRDLTDIFEVQDEIVSDVVNALKPRLTLAEQDRHFETPTANPDAYDYFLRGREQSLLDTEISNRQARGLLSRALEMDPNFSLACSYLGRNHILSYVNRWGETPDKDLTVALELGKRAVELDGRNPHARHVLAMAKLWLRKHEEALAAAGTAINLDSNYADGYAGKGLILVFIGRPLEAIESLDTAMRLDPHYRDMFLHIKALAYFHGGRFYDAIELSRRRLVRKPDSDISRVLLASACGHIGEVSQAREHWKEALRINPSYSLEHRQKILPYRNAADFEDIVSGLNKAGLPE